MIASELPELDSADLLITICTRHHGNIHHDDWVIQLGPNRPSDYPTDPSTPPNHPHDEPPPDHSRHNLPI